MLSVDDDRVWIDYKTILRSLLDVLADRILKRCNYTHSNKLSETLNKGNGKLVILQG
jgi:hypothetical protein